MNHYCCVPQCSSWVKRNPELSFHNFPKAGKLKVFTEPKLGNDELVDRRSMWIEKLKIEKKVSDYMRVCSLHFTDYDFHQKERIKRRTLKSRAVPSKNLPVASTEACLNMSGSPSKIAFKKTAISTQKKKVGVSSRTIARQGKQSKSRKMAVIQELLKCRNSGAGLPTGRALRKGTKEGNNNFTALQPQFIDVNSDLQNPKKKQLKKKALPNILRKSRNKELNNENEVDATEFLETTSNNIEVYIKEEEEDEEEEEKEEDINNQEQELDYNDSEEVRLEKLPQKSLRNIPLKTSVDYESINNALIKQNEVLQHNLNQTNLLKAKLEEMVKAYETKNCELIKENEHLKQNVSKLIKENEDIKKNFLSVVNEREALKNENTKLKEPLNQVDQFESSLSNKNVVDLTDINSICRICLQKSLHMKSIHDTIMFKNSKIKTLHFLEALMLIGLDSIELGDHLPNKICLKCNDRLKLFVIFKNAYAKTSQILKLYESGVFKIQNINSTENVVNVSDDHDYAEIVYDKDNTIKKDYGKCSTEIEIETPDNHESDKSEKEYFVYRQKLISNKKRAQVCPLCFKELQISDFRSHMREHKGFEKYLSGPKVSKNIKFYALPNNAVGVANDTEKLHNCPFCQKKFEAGDFLIHVDNHLKNDQFDCDKCGRVFKKRSYLVQHLLVHTKELPYSCQTCNKGFVNKQNYEFHLLTHSYKDGESPYNCEYCDRKFYNPSHLARHKTIHLENCSYSSKYRMKRCNSCMQSFNSEELLQSHRCLKTNMGLRYCRLCKKSFTTSKTYYLHMRLRHKIIRRKYRQLCTECNKVVTNLTYHKMKAHPDSVTKSLCPVCGLYVLNIYSHRLKHEPLKCNICNKEFTHSTVLKKHKMIHSSQRPFLCSSCPKSFKCLYNLQVHERIHSGIKRHVCPVCEKGFLEKSYLKKHMKVHTDNSDMESRQEYFEEEAGNEYEMSID